MRSCTVGSDVAVKFYDGYGYCMDRFIDIGELISGRRFFEAIILITL